MKPGSRWKSVVCGAEAVVVRPPKTEVTLECGGIKMVPHDKAAVDIQGGKPDHMKGSQIGKRYTDAETLIELLCVKSGEGSLSVNQRPLAAKDAKRLPASD